MVAYCSSTKKHTCVWKFIKVSGPDIIRIFFRGKLTSNSKFKRHNRAWNREDMVNTKKEVNGVLNKRSQWKQRYLDKLWSTKRGLSKERGRINYSRIQRWSRIKLVMSFLYIEPIQLNGARAFRPLSLSLLWCTMSEMVSLRIQLPVGTCL